MPDTNDASLSSLFTEVWRILKGRLEKDLPLPLAQCEVLRVVHDMGNPSMHDLAEHFKITAPSVTALVAPLVGHKYLVRKGNENDRRQVRVSLTRKGVATKLLMEKKRSAVVADLFSMLDRKDMEHLRRILTDITSNTQAL